ncbi:MAG TPA: hypothetical protein VMM12_02605 [Longimicrobiales bacterium]|nr:hypothetical protein [Longimicrobiales bacterium]
MNRIRGTALVLGLLAAPAAAQEAVLTPEVAAELASFYSRPGTTRLDGRTRLAPGSVLEGDVASIGGPVEVAGTVTGDVVVLNGDLVLLPGGRILGRAIVAGGAFEGDSAAVAAGVTRYPEALRFRREDDRIVAVESGRPGLLSAGRSTRFGRTDLMLTVDGSYNRVEGLPITLGPRIELGESNPTVLDARLIYRTRSGLRVHPGEFGHILRLEQYVGGHRSLLFGLAKLNTIDPIESAGVTDTENSLSTFVLHRDYRDHYTRRGWSAYLRFIGRARPYEAGIALLDEAHGSVQPGTPWSLLYNDDPWRPQPQVAEGELRTLQGWLRWDTRNDREDPATGWWLQVEAEQGLEGDLAVLVPGPTTGGTPPFPLVERPVSAEYTAVLLDARRYLRLGPRTRLAVRALFDGSADDGALPPQRQGALGGEGNLPGYDRFRFDCDARTGEADAEGYFPYYGCDRVALLQGELRLAILPGFSLGRRLGADFDLLTTPELVFFADAGRAWIEPESVDYRAGLGPRALRFDAGVGLRLGRLGLYIATPIDGDGGPNFFVRLGPRL